MSDIVMELPPKVFRGTNRHEGYKEFFKPGDGAMRFLGYARVIFSESVKSHALETKENEYLLFCIKAPVKVETGGQSYELGLHDLLYLPRNCSATISGDPGADVVLGYAPSDRDGEVQLVRFDDVKDDPNYYFDVGSEELGTKRRIHNMLAHNVKASRLLAGFTIGAPSAWTSWPPHEHTTTKEEYYLFFDMPKPAFSVQFVYSSTDDAELREVVQDGDCVTIPGGYHPTAAAPGHSSVFLWVMAAHDPERDRDFKHGIRIQPEFEAIKFV